MTAIVGAATAVLVIAVVAFRILFRVYFIPSEAMQPTLSANSHITVRLTDSVNVGDIVVYRNPGPGTFADVVHRVVAIGGQRLEIVDGNVTIDGELLDEPYLSPGMETPTLEPISVTLPPRTFFAMGDNRRNSADSRAFGLVPEDDVVGVAVIHARWPGLLLNATALLVVPLFLGLMVRDWRRARLSSGRR